MHVLSILGDGATAVADDVIGRVDGATAVVDARSDAAADGGAAFGRSTPDDRPAVRYALDEDGWRATGSRDRSLTDILDELAPQYDVALVAGATRPRLPTVVLDGRDDDAVAGDVVGRADEPAAVDPDELATTAETAQPWVTLGELVERARSAPGQERSGAIATFTGRVRERDGPDDERTTHLAFERYEGVADERMATIESELEDREGVFDVRTHHRVGHVDAGEDIVFVVVLAGHRSEAFRAVKDGIDRLKEEVPIFKKETTVDEEFWLHER